MRHSRRPRVRARALSPSFAEATSAPPRGSGRAAASLRHLRPGRREAKAMPADRARSPDGTPMNLDASRYRVKLAETDAERAGAQRLRYRVFVEEMGAEATPEERALRREWDAFDPWFDHLILESLDPSIADPLDRVVGVYRLMRDAAARAGPGFYGAGEYDLAPILAAGRPSLELGRSCVAPEHRGGAAMHLLWNGLAEYVLDRGIELLFGVASFPGTDPEPLAEALSFLHHRHLAPPDLRVRARPEHCRRHGPAAARGDRRGPRPPGDPAADQGLPPPRRFRRRGRLRRPRLQHRRRLRRHGHRPHDRALRRLLPARPGSDEAATGPETGPGREGRLERRRAGGPAAAHRPRAAAPRPPRRRGGTRPRRASSRSSCRSAASTSCSRASPAGR